MAAIATPALSAEFSPSLEIPKMQDGGSLKTVIGGQPRRSLVDSASEACAASREASQCAVPAKKVGIGFGDLIQLCDESRSYRTWSAAFLFAPPVLGGSDGRAHALPVLARAVRFANPFEPPPLFGDKGGGFCKPQLLEATHG